MLLTRVSLACQLNFAIDRVSVFIVVAVDDAFVVSFVYFRFIGGMK